LLQCQKMMAIAILQLLDWTDRQFEKHKQHFLPRA